MKGIAKSLTAAVFMAVVLTIASVNVYAGAPICTPISAQICVAGDDVTTVYLNGSYIGVFNYVNWDQNGVYPPCQAIPVTYIAQDNFVALDVKNTACCEIWGSWSIEVQCAGGWHSCISSDDNPMQLYNVPTPSETPPPDDGMGRHWYEPLYTQEPAPTWTTAEIDTGTIYGKLIYNPCTGTRLQPRSYSTGGSGPTPGNHIYMRQPFALTPIPTLPPPSFSISKTVTSKTTDINTNDRVTYVLYVCNTGRAEVGSVVVTDDFDDGFSFDGPYGGDCDGYGDGSPCSQGNSGYFTTKWMRGFPGNTCVSITAKVVDYWLDSVEYCQVRPNWAGVHWASAEFTPVTLDARSNTVNVQMYCPSSTSTRTITPVVNTPTFTPTFTITPTVTPSRTRTPIFTWTQTNSHTYSPTLTVTPTLTFTLTITRTWTVSNTHTPHPSGTETFTPTYTRTLTNTITLTVTRTVTRTNTTTWTHSPTFTHTVTVTVTLTATVTNTWANAITLAKTESTQIAELGDTVQYCISFTNVGSAPASFTIWDTVPGPMDFLFCTTESDGTACDGPATYASGLCVEYEPSHSCRVISWDMANVPPGATGSVCFWVLVARLQTAENLNQADGYFAGLFESLKKKLYRQYAGAENVEIKMNIRGPDKTD